MDSKNAKYMPFPEHSPYVKGDRYELLKEDHKYFIAKLKKTMDPSKKYSLCDVGCGNGEMVYQFKKAFPLWEYTGYDFTQEFIDTALQFPGLKGSRFERKDILEIGERESFDIVFCSSVLQIFPDFEKPLENLLGLCKKGGTLFVDGLFNPYDIEVRLQYCDNTKPETQGKWRTDWNQHSQASVKRFLVGKASSVTFEEVVNELDIAENPKAPINRWTFRDSKGKNRATNGTHLIMPRILMTVQK